MNTKETLRSVAVAVLLVIGMMAPVATACADCSGFLVAVSSASAEVRPLKEAPAPDQAVVDGPADTKFSREWWKVQEKKFELALDEKNTELVVSLAREVADGGWLYDAPGTHIMLESAVGYLQRVPERQSDLIMLMTARTEALQYVRPGNDRARDVLAAEVLRAPYERALVYLRSGQYLLAVPELERYYTDVKAEPALLKNAEDLGSCPDEKTVLVDLIEAHLALALIDEPPPDVAQQHFRSAFNYISDLGDYAHPDEVFMWRERKLAAHLVKRPVWTVGSLALYLAREMHVPASEYIELAGSTLDLMGPEAFSLDESLWGQTYLETEGSSETVIWDFLEMYQAYFAAGPAGNGSYEYQRCALNRLQFAITHGNKQNAQAVIAELSGVAFANPTLLERFNKLQRPFQGILPSPPPQMPLSTVMDGMAKGMRTDARSFRAVQTLD